MALKSAFRGVLQINGVLWPPATGGEWDAYTGGKFTQKEVKYTPYDEDQRVYAAIKEKENITLEADYKVEVFGPLLNEWTEKGEDIRGQKAMVVIKERGTDGNFQQNRPPYEGLILDVVLPEGDSNDATAIEKIQVVVSVGKPEGSGE